VADDDRAIARLMLFVRRPYHLSEQEAHRWMQAEVAPLVQSESVRGVQVSRLQAPAVRGTGEWDWLIEVHYDDAEDAGRAARQEVCRDLVADLRLLGMQPRLVLADASEPLEG
jgi:hypothetical protein